jgi:DNA-binding PadR family transcriptional regulator
VNLRDEILTTLQKGEGYGLSIARDIRRRTGEWANVYPVLRMLERDGILLTRNGPPRADRGDRPRTYYRLKEAK